MSVSDFLWFQKSTYIARYHETAYMRAKMQTAATLFLALLCASEVSSECAVEKGVRLVGFSSKQAGRVEVCRGGVWRAVCLGSNQTHWSHRNSIVACRLLGFTSAVTLSSHDRLSLSSSINYTQVECSGLEKSISDCSLRDECGPAACAGGQALVMCTDTPAEGTLRLVGPGSEGSGTVEVYTASYRWSGVCTNEWGQEEAAVVCRQLGFASGNSYTTWSDKVDFYRAKRLDAFRCTGTESSLLDCEHYTYPQKCYTSHYAAVTCSHSDSESNGDSDCHSLPLHVIMVYITVQLGIILAVMVTVFVIIVIWRNRRNGMKTAQASHAEPDTQAPPRYEDAAQGTLLEAGVSSGTTPTTPDTPTTSTPEVIEAPPTDTPILPETMTRSGNGSITESSRQLL